MQCDLHRCRVIGICESRYWHILTSIILFAFFLNTCDTSATIPRGAIVDSSYYQDVGIEEEPNLEHLLVRQARLSMDSAAHASRRRRSVGPLAKNDKTRSWNIQAGRYKTDLLQTQQNITTQTIAPDRPTTGPVTGFFPLPPYSKWPRGVEFVIGIVLGILVTFFGWLVYLGCLRPRKLTGPPWTASASSSRTLDSGKFVLAPFEFQGGVFNQFSWTLHCSDSGFRHPHDCIARVYDSHEQQIACGIGRLMSTPNGEMCLASIGPDKCSDAWCILRRPAPSRRPGQLWDFKICHANGANHAEVKQRSETKCLVNDAMSKHMVMTVIGNFNYPVFLSGERSIHVWATQVGAPPCMVAQCEAKLEGLDTRIPGMWADSSGVDTFPTTDTFPEFTSESISHLPPSNIRFVVTAIADIDASLVLAVLLGLQDVHCSGRPDTHAEHSSASTGSSWRDFGGMRASSGGSTVATLGSEGRFRQPRLFSQAAKAAPVPPEAETEV